MRRLIDSGIKFLSSASDERLGGVCLIGLAFVKDDQPEHPKVKAALDACRKARQKGDAGDVYSNGIALIFLCELGGDRNRDLTDFFLGALERRQKNHGGWGYDASTTGDTSQTQYGTLGIWEAHRKRFSVTSDSAERCLDWVVRTQDPTGAWGYQGTLAEPDKRVKQREVRHSMVAAGMSSLLVCADLFGLLEPGAADSQDSTSALPTGFRQAEDRDKKRAVRPLSSRGIDKDRLFKAVRDGQAWMDENYTTSVSRWKMYYLYSIERYKSFEELLLKEVPEEPTWYNEGYKILAGSQKSDGSWKDSGGGGEAVDTAFAVLFLLRSTQKSLRRGLGEGVMLSGRGAPADAQQPKKIRVGNKLVDATSAQLSDMFALLDEGQADALDALAADPTAFVGGPVDEKTARRLQQIVRGGAPSARRLAVRSLGRSGELDYVPTLLYALTDPDRGVTLEARDGLRFISRRFEGYGLSDRFTEKERYEVLDKWKNWYLTFRPDAVLDL